MICGDLIQTKSVKANTCKKKECKRTRSSDVMKLRRIEENKFLNEARDTIGMIDFASLSKAKIIKILKDIYDCIPDDVINEKMFAKKLKNKLLPGCLPMVVRKIIRSREELKKTY